MTPLAALLPLTLELVDFHATEKTIDRPNAQDGTAP
jgi:hypothetical protein